MTKKIVLQLVREAKLASSAIAWFTQGEFSHVDAVMSDGYLLGSYEKEVGNIPSGVQRRPPGYREWARCVQFAFDVPDQQAIAWETALNSQLGKPYDWSVIFGFVSGRNWRQRDAWICSELQAWAIEKVSLCQPLYLAANKISPNALALVASALPGVSRISLR